MNILKIDLHHPDSAALERAVDFLREGRVVLHATETCYGFAVDIFQEQALRKLYELKKMALDKPTSMMVRDFGEAEKYAEFHSPAKRIAEKFWPGAVTLILPRKKSLPEFFNPGHATVGIRCPDSVIAQFLIQGVGHPISTTSANISGKPEVYKIEDFVAQLSDAERSVFEKDLLILDSGELPRNPPSTLVDFVGEQGRIVREGALKDEVLAFLS